MAWGGVVFLHFPILIIVAYALNIEDVAPSFPPQGPTLRWFSMAVQRNDILDAVTLLLKVAALATLIALALGTLAVAALWRRDFFGKNAISLLLLLPTALPGIVTGLALLIAFKIINLEPGFFTIVVGYATFCVVMVFNNVITRFRRTSWSLVEVSMDLGVNDWQAFRHVVLPNLSSALPAGGMLAFALSFDEIIVTTFTAGHERTLPLWLLNQPGRPRDVLVINVVALLVMLVATLPILGAWWLAREGDNGQQPLIQEYAMQHKLLTNGELANGEGGKQLVYNPATGDVLLEIAEASVEQVNAAVRTAGAAFAEWGQTTPKVCAKCLPKLTDVIEENGWVFVELEPCSCGKPLHSVFNDEIPAIADVSRFLAGATCCLNGLAVGEYLEGHTPMIRCDPLGVAAFIAPWNYPLMMAAQKLASALAVGDRVVLKPSEITPLTALKLVELAKGIFPAGAINILFGRDKTVGDLLTGHPEVRTVSLTGSIATGRHIISHTASFIKRTHTGLGDKAPVVASGDVDIEAVVEGVRTFGYYSAGQDCTVAYRIYAQRSIHDTLVEKLGAAVVTLESDVLDGESMGFGLLNSLAHLECAGKAVEEARATGHVKVTTGGKKRKGNGYYYVPTLLAGILRDDAIVQKRVFGPVVSTTPFDSEEQVMNWVNDNQYGFASSAWMKDVGGVHRVSARL